MNFLLDSFQGTVLGMLVILSITVLILVVVMRLPRKIKNILENLSIAQSRENSEILNSLADRLLRNQSTLNENLRSFLSNELNQLRSNSGAFQVKLIE